MFTIEALPAEQGDCLLLRYGSKTAPRLMIIDGGPGDVYWPTLAPRLQELKADRKLSEKSALPLDLVIVSHIDDDHIGGILELMDEIAEAKDNRAPLPYRVGGVWHNSFDEVIGTTPEVLESSISAKFGAASTAEAVLARRPELAHDAAMILASVAQGRRLRDAVKKLRTPLNSAFDGKPAMLDGADPKRIIDMGDGLEFVVVGPMQSQLKKLKKKHDDWLKKNKKSRKDAEATLAAFADGSAANLSSIVIHATCAGKSMLLTGDARGDFIEEGLLAAGLMSKKKPYVTDVLKVPHHGSDNNVTEGFFQNVRATHYVFSGNGEHGNPERTTFEMLFAARESVESMSNDKFSIHLTYPIDEIDRNRKAEWERQFARGRKTRKWDPQRDGLEAFFDEANDSSLKFELNDAPGRVELTLAK